MGMEDARPWTLYCHQRAKIGIVAMQILGPTANRTGVYPMRLEFCFRTDPESDQADGVSLELESHREFVVPPCRAPDLKLVSSFGRAVIRQWLLINTYY
jgi:hypothetical protein